MCQHGVMHRSELQRAIEDEDYAEAAVIRDKLQGKNCPYVSLKCCHHYLFPGPWFLPLPRHNAAQPIKSV